MGHSEFAEIKEILIKMYFLSIAGGQSWKKNHGTFNESDMFVPRLSLFSVKSSVGGYTHH